MIRVIVVEDDFRVAKLHAELVNGVRGMTVVGVAHTAADALRLAGAEKPNLVLIDEYLPDQRGSDLLGRLGAPSIVVSADTDPRTARRWVAGGAVNVVLKPFAPQVLTQRLTAFARVWESLAATGNLDQRAIDRAFAGLHDGDSAAGAVPKGRSAVTADAIRDALERSAEMMTATEVAEAIGASRATAQRYLSDLAAAGRVELALRYGATGRPEHRYGWRS